MSESDLKYSYDQTKVWATKENATFEDGVTFLYIFGAFSFLIIFAAVLLFFAGGSTDVKESTVRIDELNSETDATTTEVHAEFDLLDDVKKDKNLLKAAK